LIATLPLKECPACKYSLEGLPGSSRCPECGLELDEGTVVHCPSRPWKTCFGLLGSELLLFYLLGPLTYGFLESVLGPALGKYTALAGLVLVPLGTVIQVYLSNRKGRFVAVTSSGIAVRNLHGLVFVSWEDFSMLSIVDTSPWIKRRGQDQTISLRGVFDNRQEMRVFQTAVSHANAAHSRAQRKCQGDSAEPSNSP